MLCLFRYVPGGGWPTHAKVVFQIVPPADSALENTIRTFFSNADSSAEFTKQTVGDGTKLYELRVYDRDKAAAANRVNRLVTDLHFNFACGSLGKNKVRILAAPVPFSPNPPRSESAGIPFTFTAREVLGLSFKEAKRLGGAEVASEHMLLGLLALRRGIAWQLIQQMGVNPPTLRAQIEEQIAMAGRSAAVARRPYARSSKQALALAKKETDVLGHAKIGTGHLLLGLLRTEGLAAEILRKNEIDIERTRTALVAIDAVEN